MGMSEHHQLRTVVYSPTAPHTKPIAAVPTLSAVCNGVTSKRVLWNRHGSMKLSDVAPTLPTTEPMYENFRCGGGEEV